MINNSVICRSARERTCPHQARRGLYGLAPGAGLRAPGRELGKRLFDPGRLRLVGDHHPAGSPSADINPAQCREQEEQIMSKYKVLNVNSWIEFGIYEAASEEEALDAMARDAGYASYQACCEQVPGQEDDIVARLVAED